ncbi:MAG: serine hydrolase [Candidatus Thorarchaeota archaeon]
MSKIKELENFDSYLEEICGYWDAPGIACIALKNNEVVYSGATGLRDIKNNLPMTTKTVQPIGSCAKAFTSTAIAMLVEDGKLAWDLPLHKIFPKFEMKDSIASHKATLIDMLSHRTGLPRHDMLWALNSEFTYDKIFDYLPHLDSSRDFRTTFQYLEGHEMIVDLPDELRKSGAIDVRKKFGTNSGGDILDVGTQDGDFIKVLMKVLRDYDSFTGIDISEDDVKEGETQFKKDPVHFKVMNAEEMTFHDDQFDTVCISYSIHHLENIDGVLSEMYRVLKPGGYFIIQELYSDGEQTTAQFVDKLVHNLNIRIDTLLGIPHFESLTREQLRNAAKELI